MEKQIKTFSVDTKALDPEQGIYEAMLSTEAVDRDGDILLASGADTSAYQKNPVVLFGHNYGDPEAVVAKALEITTITGQGIKLTFQFLQRGISQTADLVRALWDQHFLNAMSIGFIPKESEPRTDGNGLIFKAFEVLEGSIVTIPSNASALRLALDATEYSTKSGRVLSAANEGKIRQAVEMLTKVLEQLDKNNEEEKDIRPYPNEHACRLKDPDDFAPNSFRRTTREHEGKKYSVIMGKLKGEDGMTEQAYRYAKDVWTAEQAKSHCNSHDGISFEPATGKCVECGEVKDLDTDDGQPETTNIDALPGDALEMEDLTDQEFDEMLQGINEAADLLKEKYNE